PSGSTLGPGHDRSEDCQTHLGESWTEVGGLAWIPARLSDKPLSARRLRQDDSGDTASRQRFHDHEPVRQGRGIGCGGRDAGLRSGFMQRLRNGSGFEPISGCCIMMKINTFLMRRDVWAVETGGLEIGLTHLLQPVLNNLALLSGIPNDRILPHSTVSGDYSGDRETTRKAHRTLMHVPIPGRQSCGKKATLW